MTSYICELCKKTFPQKSEYDRHKKRKAPCISISEIQKMTQINDQINSEMAELLRVLRSCQDILRDSEGITGNVALRNLGFIMVLKMIEPYITARGIDTYNYTFPPNFPEQNKTKLRQIVRFSELIKIKEGDIPINIEQLWTHILSQHPATCKIFIKKRGFDIRKPQTFSSLFAKITELNLNSDSLGFAYEEFIKDIMKGRTLGQFFTPPAVRKKLVKLVNAQMRPDGTIPSCCDPAMGTCGLLIAFLHSMLNQAKTRDIVPNWDQIKTEGLYGKEIDPDTYQLGISNMLISTGHMFDSMDCGDSLRDPILRKFDYIVANMPFGIDGLKYDDIQHAYKGSYIPIKTKNAVLLFLQAIMCMLNVGGSCAVIIPSGGKETQSKTSEFVLTREYLMKTCDLKGVYYLPSGIFTNTGSRTCILYFIKRREVGDVLQVNQPETSNKSKSKTEYRFSKTYQTNKVTFYDYNPYEDVETVLSEVSIEEIANNSYSLNYMDYEAVEEDIGESDNTVVKKPIDELCKFIKKSKRSAKHGMKTGRYPFFKSSLVVNRFVDVPDYTTESLIIGDGGEPNINYGLQFSASNHCYIMQNKLPQEVLLKYVYYYMLNNLKILEPLYTGIGIKNIPVTKLKRVKIPIPDIAQQQEIIDYCEKNDARIRRLEQEIAQMKQVSAGFIANITHTVTQPASDNSDNSDEEESEADDEGSECPDGDDDGENEVTTHTASLTRSGFVDTVPTKFGSDSAMNEFIEITPTNTSEETVLSCDSNSSTDNNTVKPAVVRGKIRKSIPNPKYRS
jgi:type I restriction-modification system DNA methylase subunit